MSRRPGRRALFYVIFWSSSLAVAMIIGELAARIARTRSPTAQVFEPAPPYQFDSIYGWSKTPGVSATVTTSEYRVSISINALGMRGPEATRTKPPGATRLLLVGDSFLEAYTVPEEASVARQLEKALGSSSSSNVQVLNAGTAGYSTDQELLYVLREAASLQPDAIVLFFYRNDVYYNVMPRYWRGPKPYFEESAGRLVLRGVPIRIDEGRPQRVDRGGPPVIRAIRRLDGWIGNRSALFAITRDAVERSPMITSVAIRLGISDVPGEYWPLQVQPAPAVAHAWEITEALIGRMRDEAHAIGAAFHVFYVPAREVVEDDAWRRMSRAFVMTEPDWNRVGDADHLAAICDRLVIECTIPVREFRAAAAQAASGDGSLYFTHDEHWTPSGHALAARVLARDLEPRLR